MQSLNAVLRLGEGTESSKAHSDEHVVLRLDGVAFMDIFVYDALVARELAAALLESAYAVEKNFGESS